jgi:hypothetical protein
LTTLSAGPSAVAITSFRAVAELLEGQILDQW